MNSKELGKNLFRIASKLDTNDDLRKLLKNTSINPLDDPKPASLLHKNIKIVPSLKEEDFSTESGIALLFPSIDVTDNRSYKNTVLKVVICCPLQSWIINDINLRPFLILGEIEEMLKGIRVNGLGTLELTNINLDTLTDIVGIYSMYFIFTIDD